MKKSEDELLLAERVGAQQSEIEDLKIKVQDAEHAVHHEQYLRKFESVWVMGLWTVFLTVLFLAGGYPLYMNLTTPNVPVNCQIVWYAQSPPTVEAVDGGKLVGQPDPGSLSGVYRLWGEVPWHSDRTYGEYWTLEGALEAAERLQCRLRTTIPRAH